MAINILPEDVVRRIAAGEVIERPVSVVKELIENSLDAGATRIEIRIEAGGIEGITVIDNGCGIQKEDIPKLLNRHSTSKIKNEADLYSISTLGFRGEALYSIASVTKLRIRTRAKGEAEGTELISENGRILINSVSAPVGTTVEATGLFHNTPARRKFLKSPSSEFVRIADVVARYVLAYPKISFELINNGKTVFHSYGGGSEDPIIAIWGARVAAQMLPIDYRSEKICVSGFISAPSLSRSTRKDITIFVNGRLIKDSSITLAIEKAFENILKPGRYPIAIVKIQIRPSDVDVNVHPNKREVRFANPNEVFSIVKATCEKALRMHRPLMRPDSSPTQHDSLANSHDDIQCLEKNLELSDNFLTHDNLQKNIEGLFKIPLQPIHIKQGEVIEFLNTYLVFEDSGELAIVDFHNLHERILFEEMNEAEKPCEKMVVSQKLIFPETFALPPDLAEAIEDNFDFITRMGFDVEPFGNGAFILRAVPHFVKESSAAELLIDILRATLDENFDKSQPFDFRKRFKITTACKSAIKAGTKLKPEEIQFLLRHATDARFMNCPHGRPTIIKLDRSFFDSRFKRKSNI